MKTTAPPPHTVPGDRVYFRHPQRGPISGRVLSTGRDGLAARCHRGNFHHVLWNDLLGHQERLPQSYQIVETGEDGVILQDSAGRRQYVATADPGGKPLTKAHVHVKEHLRHLPSGRTVPIHGYDEQRTGKDTQTGNLFAPPRPRPAPADEVVPGSPPRRARRDDATADMFADPQPAPKPEPKPAPKPEPKPDASELLRLDLISEFNAKWRYRMRPGGKWYFANSKEGAIESATETYRSADPADLMTQQERGEKADREWFESMDRRFSTLSDDEIEKLIKKERAAAESLRVAPEKEIPDTGRRNTRAATMNEGSRESAQSARDLTRYLQERRANKPKPAPAVTITDRQERTDLADLKKYGEEGLRERFYWGTIDRLQLKGHIKKPVTKSHLPLGRLLLKTRLFYQHLRLTPGADIHGHLIHRWRSQAGFVDFSPTPKTVKIKFPNITTHGIKLINLTQEMGKVTSNKLRDLQIVPAERNLR